MIKELLLDLKNRGILNNITNEEKVSSLKQGDGIYVGFDPTATSLHLGNYIPMTILKRFSKVGLKPYAVLGGATGMIGDPSFKNAERQLLDNKTLEINKQSIRKQLEAYGFKVIDNFDFYKNMNVLEFLRDIGKNININYMINKDSISSRLESGLSYTEFSYTLLQGYDFSVLYKKYGIKIQAGGSDQWGNITTGLELIRKYYGDNDALGITMNLLTDSNGNKFGKSLGGAIWLDKEKNSSFSLYQFFVNQNDNDIEKLLKWYSMKDLKEIENIIKKHAESPKLKLAQKELAFEIVKDLHGAEDAVKAKEITEILFESKKEITEISIEQIENIKNDIPFYNNNGKEIELINLLVEANIVSSKREGREFINQGAIFIDGVICKDEKWKVVANHFNNEYLIIKKGKRNYYLIKY